MTILGLAESIKTMERPEPTVTLFDEKNVAVGMTEVTRGKKRQPESF